MFKGFVEILVHHVSRHPNLTLCNRDLRKISGRFCAQGAHTNSTSRPQSGSECYSPKQQSRDRCCCCCCCWVGVPEAGNPNGTSIWLTRLTSAADKTQNRITNSRTRYLFFSRLLVPVHAFYVSGKNGKLKKKNNRDANCTGGLTLPGLRRMEEVR